MGNPNGVLQRRAPWSYEKEGAIIGMATLGSKGDRVSLCLEKEESPIPKKNCERSP